MTREEAIARARKWNLGNLDEEDTTALYELIPELRESEDERIRKEIIHYILYKAKGVSEEQEHAWVAYLERQKEHLRDSTKMLGQEPIDGKALLYTADKSYEIGYRDGKMDAQKEQKPVHTAKEMWEKMRLEVYAQASGNRHEPNCSDDSTKMFSLCDIDEIFEKIGNATVGSQPAEWSEEDEKRIQRIYDFMWKNRKGDTDTIYQIEKDADWLKSLRPQPRWKPTGYQINSLLAAEGIARADNYPEIAKVLASLYEKLKEDER